MIKNWTNMFFLIGWLSVVSRCMCSDFHSLSHAVMGYPTQRCGVLWLQWIWPSARLELTLGGEKRCLCWEEATILKLQTFNIFQSSHQGIQYQYSNRLFTANPIHVSEVYIWIQSPVLDLLKPASAVRDHLNDLAWKYSTQHTDSGDGREWHLQQLCWTCHFNVWLNKSTINHSCHWHTAALSHCFAKMLLLFLLQLLRYPCARRLRLNYYIIEKHFLLSAHERCTSKMFKAERYLLSVDPQKNPYSEFNGYFTNSESKWIYQFHKIYPEHPWTMCSHTLASAAQGRAVATWKPLWTAEHPAAAVAAEPAAAAANVADSAAASWNASCADHRSWRKVWCCIKGWKPTEYWG